ncbi:MAG: phage tail tape measure protein [Hyphomicrobium sp.]|nr:phage tail tape measure protein [Hyphomicrobium sp.]
MAEWNDPADTMTVQVTADTTQFQQQIADAARLGRQFGNSLVTAFDGIAIKGKGVSDVLRSLALNLSQLVLKAALRPLTNSIGGALSGLVGGGLPFAMGGVLQRRMPVPFASGGVISSPVTFPLAGGRVGLAGERGAEAILPLARGPDGRLGVAAQGTGGGVAVTFNVTTPDAESFRRSEAQVAAMVARAVALGQRNL